MESEVSSYNRIRLIRPRRVMPNHTWTTLLLDTAVHCFSKHEHDRTPESRTDPNKTKVRGIQVVATERSPGCMPAAANPGANHRRRQQCLPALPATDLGNRQ